ncbi:MAG: HPr family phosphocarrier protein [Phycisphaerae bacterium]
MAESAESVVREVTIAHHEGFHTRPVMTFVDLAQRFDAKVRVVSLNKPDEVVNGKSAMELMLLGATEGTTLRIEATGRDAHEAVEALVGLVDRCFDIQP